jgi:hypothetical protein
MSQPKSRLPAEWRSGGQGGAFNAHADPLKVQPRRGGVPSQVQTSPAPSMNQPGSGAGSLRS